MPTQEQRLTTLERTQLANNEQFAILLGVIGEHDQHKYEMMREQLERIGVQIRIAHFTGDSSYPTEYQLRYSFVEAVGPTFDLAVSAFVEALLRHVPVEKA